MSIQSSETTVSARGSGPITLNDVGVTPEELLAAIDATIKPFSDGDLVSGIVVKIDKEEVLVDIGYKSEGVIPVKELSIRHDVDPSKIVSLGEPIEALVLQKEDKDGRLILSKKRAQYEKAWGRVEELKKSGEIVKGMVIEVVKGGLIVDIGLRGFLPASLIELRRVRDLQSYVGKEIDCKIIELDKHRNNVVLSRRAFLEEASSVSRKEFLEKLEVGKVVRGTVSSVVSFGAFIDLGGVDGLVHVSELSWKHVDHPGEVVQVGQEVDVKILNVELERDRVSLSLRSTQGDPWEEFAKANQPGDVAEGVITKLVPFGAFVELAEGIEGLVHISELADGHVETAEQVVSMGQKVKVRLIEVDSEKRRIGLSLKQAESPLAEVYTTTTTPKPAEGEIAPELEAEPELQREPEPELQREPEPELEREPEAAPVAEVEAPAEIEAEAAPPAEAVAESPAEVEVEAEAPAAEVSEAAQPEVELEGELLDAVLSPGEESLEDIVQDMQRDQKR
jgi:small subunit ribosomal protein S1